MKLSNDAIAEFERNGILILPKLFSESEVDRLIDALQPLMCEETPANIREKSSGEVRTAMGLHLRSELYSRLVRHPRLIEPAAQILCGEPLYIQQVKVNIKPAFVGEAWQWHYDFATHSHEDGVPEPLALNLHIFLDEVTEFNGPLFFIPGSHRYGPAPATLDTVSTSYPLWVVDADTVGRLAKPRGMISPPARKALC